MKKTYAFAGIALLAAVTLIAAVAGVDVFGAHPAIAHMVSPELAGLSGAGALAFAGIGNVELIEIKDIIEKQGKAWEEHKKTNDELMKAKADGKAVADLEAKLAKIGEDLDKYADLKSQFDDVLKKMQRPGAGGKDDEEAAAEVKGFNQMLRADYQSKGKHAPAEMDAEQYAHYKSGFFKLVAGMSEAGLDDAERKAMSAGADPDGGYLLPHATVGRMVAKIYEQSTMRQLATVVPISTEKLEGIIDNDEAGAGWVSEMGSRDDTKAPQVGKYEIEAHEMYAQPKATQKILDDAATDVEAWLAGKTADKFARVEGAAFTTGDGVGKPRGLFAYPTAAESDDTRKWGTFEFIKSGANGALSASKADPLQDLIGATKDQYLQNATWLMRRELRTAIRKLKSTGDDRYLWEPSLQAGQPDRLLGYAARVDQFVPAMAQDSLSLAFGDIREAYTIVDRMGIRTLRDPYTQKPYIKFYSTKRTGGGAVNFEAVKFLKLSA